MLIKAQVGILDSDRHHDPITKLQWRSRSFMPARSLGNIFIVSTIWTVINCCDRAVLMKDGKVVGGDQKIVEHHT